jgi:hypothetical protein
MASRRTGSNEQVLVAALQASAVACRACGEECAKHGAHHAHCALCAQSCDRCAAACDDAISSIPRRSH